MDREIAPPAPETNAQASWSDAASRDAIQLIADGVTRVAGFGIAAISVVRGDPGYLEVMAVAGSDAAREELKGRHTPIEQLAQELEKADDWGLLRFVPHERLEPGLGETWGWVPDVDPIDDAPDAWHPMDLLRSTTTRAGCAARWPWTCRSTAGAPARRSAPRWTRTPSRPARP
jgi:hypothetical protein